MIFGIIPILVLVSLVLILAMVIILFTNSSEMDKNILLRRIYLYLFSAAGLICIIIGSVVFLNSIMNKFIFPDLKLPIADAIVSQAQENQYTFDATPSRDRDGQVTAYEWRVNGERVSAEKKTDYTFNNSGNHTVELVVTDNDNLKSSYSRNVCIPGEKTTCTTTNEKFYEPRADIDNEWEVNQFRRDMKTSLAFLLVGIPLFVFHWRRIQMEAKEK